MTDLSPLELAALFYDWPQWARDKQIPPPTAWLSFSLVTGRGYGKTRSNAQTVVAEIMAGRARDVLFAAHNLDETERTMMHGPAGLIACSPPWWKPITNKGILVFPNGATCTPMTPEVPNGPRGGNRDLAWLSELSSFPAATREEFFSNVRLSLRTGAGRMLVDTTPKARNPLVRWILERGARDPVRHVVVRGSTRDNADNLTADFVTELEAELSGTQRGREELDGVFFDDADGALWKQAWIDDHRRDIPTEFKRRILSIDPAITAKKGSDRTGLIELGLGIDDQVFVLADNTDRMPAEVWGALLIARYFANRCDCIVVETNRGGHLVTSNIRAAAAARGLRVEVVEPNAITRHTAGTVLVKETHARRGKDVRAEPVATLYQRGRVSHVRGADLTELEESMLTWSPEAGGASPDGMDALVHGVYELAGLGREGPKGSNTVGAAKLQSLITKAPQPPASLAALLGRRRGGDGI